MLYDSLPRPFFVLAPMDDVTDTVFRQIIATTAPPDLFFTEFVNVDGLQSRGKPRLMHKLAYTAKEKPLIAQIWGKTPINYELSAKELVEMGFAGIDINMGCPVKDVVKNGCCSALINNRDLAVEIIKAVKRGAKGRVPITVKTRLGWDSVDYSWHELILKQGIDMLTVHGRTRSEMSKVPARWQDIAVVRDLRDKISPKTLIVGNGDVQNRLHGEQLAAKYKLDGIMIGRAIFNDPYIFAKESPWPSLEPIQKIELYKKQVKLFIKYYPNKERSPQTLKCYAKIYINGFDGASSIRSEVMSTNSAEELKVVLSRYLLS
ncbi:MAG: tRNA-dihydrouridine synthase [Patescibacteria group bacterium]|jgi:tRNA-dihydrouridine synthase|nr:tRNA-dihydrouridine synthase [Patescibacteria group bacterium]